MAYCILRFQKIKSRASLVRSAQHNSRERLPGNADPEKGRGNAISAASAEVMARYDQLLPSKVRKDAVHAVEAVVTMSPSAWADVSPKERTTKLQQYAKDAMEWVTKALGGKKNVLGIYFHTDERTPHLHVLMMPLVAGKLNAKYYIGGHRDHMKQLQDDFYEKVGKKHGLDRGLAKEETGARHISIKQYYGLVDAQAKAMIKQEALIRKAEIQRLKKIHKGEGQEL